MKSKIYLIALCASVYFSDAVYAEQCPTFTMQEFLRATQGMISKEGQPIFALADGKGWKILNVFDLPVSSFTNEASIHRTTPDIMPSGLCRYAIDIPNKSSVVMVIQKVTPKPLGPAH